MRHQIETRQHAAADTIGRAVELTEAAKLEMKLADDAWSSAVGHAVRAGQLLTEAKGLVRHGEWLPWLERHGIAPRTAQVHMRLAANTQRVAHLDSVREALAALTVPQKPERKMSVEEARMIVAMTGLALALPVQPGERELRHWLQQLRRRLVRDWQLPETDLQLTPAEMAAVVDQFIPTDPPGPEHDRLVEVRAGLRA